MAKFMRQTTEKRQGLTLAEMVVVLVILVALAGIVVPLFSSSADNSRNEATLASMYRLRDVLIGSSNQPGYLQDMRGVLIPSAQSATGQSTGIPDKLQDLFVQPTGAPNFDPNTKLGWRGPYLTNTGAVFNLKALDPSFNPTPAYGTQSAPAILDAWGNPIVLQWPTTNDSVDIRAQYVRLISAGPPSKQTAAGPVAVIGMPANILDPASIPASARGKNNLVLFLRVPDPNATNPLTQN
jgi:prepilin-type N-terminal cleavage/methylation domain-containing protein